MEKHLKAAKDDQQKVLFYKIGNWCFILVGIGHLIGHFLTPKTSEQLEMMQKMKEFSIAMPGRETNLLFFHTGFSIMMGIMLISYGYINLIFLKNNRQFNVPDKRILVTNTLVSLISLIIAIKFFFIIPIIITSLAFSAFTLALLIATKQ
ncbi:MAG: hypothetical protein MK207_13105 [Saprospiraceae bacterium]|nr:hypothetical protein [Saprospiraceae bacterium]